MAMPIVAGLVLIAVVAHYFLAVPEPEGQVRPELEVTTEGYGTAGEAPSAASTNASPVASPAAFDPRAERLRQRLDAQWSAEERMIEKTIERQYEAELRQYQNQNSRYR